MDKEELVRNIWDTLIEKIITLEDFGYTSKNNWILDILEVKNHSGVYVKNRNMIEVFHPIKPTKRHSKKFQTWNYYYLFPLFLLLEQSSIEKLEQIAYRII